MPDSLTGGDLGKMTRGGGIFARWLGRRDYAQMVNGDKMFAFTLTKNKREMFIKDCTFGQKAGPETRNEL